MNIVVSCDTPIEPIFVTAATSKGHGSSYVDSMGFASLTVWNMKTWKAMTLVVLFLNNLLGFMKTVLPLGKDPPAITSLTGLMILSSRKYLPNRTLAKPRSNPLVKEL
ncbi:WD repeat-containing protein 91-like [Pyrus ussuriensis x Pyrus communis]|uniref:WD repeat-containing protein 91-like n=1 Tax=Pyrus ussuriensis x Pyrus communis TaxID=2448454 RepID=A0A5N5FC59_9ROSA|nr:WD repeat-containing protein 91-like [Pyrus ussuriensis x Pyrus communis]